jgi:hypothetical protein
VEESIGRGDISQGEDCITERSTKDVQMVEEMFERECSTARKLQVTLRKDRPTLYQNLARISQ